MLKKILPYALVLGIIFFLAWVMLNPKATSPMGQGTVSSQVSSNEADAIQARFDAADMHLANGEVLQARGIYEELMQQHPEQDAGKRAHQRLNQTSLPVFFESLNENNSHTYVIKPGDNLTKIAKKFNVTAGLIAAINHVNPNKIRAGYSLKIMKDSWNMLVDKSSNYLYLKVNDDVVKSYEVATGKNDSTPAGDYVIVNRLVDPTWYYEGKVEPAGSPDNPLGTRWMGFDLDGYGLHGTTRPDEIGQYATLGCIRLHNDHIEELFELIPVGTPIKIME